MPAQLSQLELAQRDTLVHRAEGAALRELSRFYGVSMPENWNETSWRRGLRAVATGPRGRPGGTFAFLEGIFAHLETLQTVTRDPALPRRVTAIGGPGTFEQSHVGRWVRIGGALYVTVGPADVVAAGGAYLSLAPVTTAYTDGANWSGQLAPDDVGMSMLAFTIEEPGPGPLTPLAAGYPCTVIVRLWLDESSKVPATYIHTVSGAARPAGEPFGGQVRTDTVAGGEVTESAAFKPGSQVKGPFPLYLPGIGAIGDAAARLKLLLAAGCHAKFVRQV